MYSMVLVMALSAPAETPTFGWRSSCTGCAGTSCAGMVHTGYSGCTGRGGFGWARGGCCGGMPNFACHGAGACYGYPLTYYGFAGCYGSCYGSYTNYFSYWSTPVNVHYGTGMPMRAAPMPAAPVPVPPRKPADPAKKAMAPAPATVVVTLPADAALFANGIRTSQVSAQRHFVTPALNPGEAYHYVFTVEVKRDGQVVREERKIEVQAGREIRVDFGTLANASRAATDVVIDGE